MAYNVDVAVVGGNTWAVAAAAAAAKGGVSVFLAASRPYLGEDMCATLKLSPAEGKIPDTELARAVFKSDKAVTPIHVKKTLDSILVKAKVDFLFGCYATDPLTDSKGNICGFIMANRAGRQAVLAKIVIDATDRAWFARMAGAETDKFPKGNITFKRWVIMPQGSGKGSRTVEHKLELSLPDSSFQSFAEAEQQARDKTYTDGQLRASESLFHVPPDPVVCIRGSAEWKGSQNPDIGHFQPAGINRLYVLSGCADIPRKEAERLLRPCGMTGIGVLVGKSAAKAAKKLPKPAKVKPVQKKGKSTGGEVKEVLTGIRPIDGASSIPSGETTIPVLGIYDVVVVGGGTSGAPAGIGAARKGARVLVLEYQEGLGGVGTLGMIGKPYHGKKIGFSREVPFPDKKHNLEHKMEWYRKEIRKAGGEIWFGVLGAGAFTKGNKVAGAVVATPEGRGVVLAKVVVDSTGNADVAIAAGAEYMYGATDDNFIAMQGTGLPSRPLNSSNVNSDYLIVDENDMLDVWRSLVGARMTMNSRQYDCGTLIQTRERRRIVGDHILTYLDQIAERTYPDTIAYSASDYDTHGYPNDPYFALIPHDKGSLKANHPAPGGSCYTPYRCLLPKELEGIIVTGLGISMERDASAMVRMQLDLQNQGYAAGVAGAMAARAGGNTRRINIRSLQKHLVEIGCLSKNVLQHKDSFPLSQKAITQAVKDIINKNRKKACMALARVLSHHKQAAPGLLQMYGKSKGEEKLRYARILGFYGSAEVSSCLIDALEKISEWDAKIFQGKMAEYGHLPTYTDSIIMALGYTRDPKGLPAILKKLEMLDNKTTLSHHRAVAIALEKIGDSKGCKPLADLLSKTGIKGHAMTGLVPLNDKPMGKRRRIKSLREIMLARALYKCGDYKGMGEKILKEYEKDIRGVFARHARAVLKNK